MAGGSGKKRGLFDLLPEAADPGFRNLRDPRSEEAALCRAYCERLWTIFAAYADDRFVDEFAVNLHQRFWEMCVAATLLDAGHKITAPKPGPDCGLTIDGRQIWVEAVAATLGEPGRPDSVPPYDPTQNAVRDVPHDRIILRCTTAINSKFPNQYRRHREMGVIGPDDCYVVALNHAQAYHFAEVGTPPYIYRTVFRLGSMFALIDRDSVRIVGGGVQYLGAVQKRSGANVNTGLFVSGDSAELSAVIASVTTVSVPVHFGQEPPLGYYFRLVGNPLARRPLPSGLIIRGQEAWAEDSGRGFRIFEKALPRQGA